MAKYKAKPVVVDAFQIKEIYSFNQSTGAYELRLENGDMVVVTQSMCARMTPTVGDYWVLQSDMYTYLNPKDVFERKYKLVDEWEE